MKPLNLKQKILHPFTDYQITKAKRKHRKANPECKLCGVMPTFFSRNNDVHHYEPVHVKPSRACDPENLVTLCRIHHWLVGHIRNWKNWNSQVDETIFEIQHTFNEYSRKCTDDD